MRVVHLVPHLEDNGNGVVAAFFTLVREQMQHPDYSIAVISRGGLMEEELSPDVLRITLAPGAHLQQLRTTMARSISDWQPDILHVHTVGMLAPVLGTKIWRSTPSVATAHSLFRRLEYLMLLADSTVAVSEANAEQLRHLSYRPSHVRTIHNAVDRPEQIPPYIAEQRFQSRLLFVGGLFERKGVHVLLEAMHLLQTAGMTVGLDILGDGPERSSLEEQAIRLHLESQVCFYGFVSDTAEFYRHASALVHPAFEEPFGLVLAEAQQYGLPIIASNVGGIPEVLDYGRAGALVQPGDPGALARAIKAVVGTPHTAQTWSAKSAEQGRGWDPTVMFEDYDILYRQTIDGRSRSRRSRHR